jgi:hypothetical protein
LHIQLSEDAFNAAWADGRAMTLGQTVAFALDAMPLPSSAAVEEAHAQPQPDTPSQAAQGGSFSRQKSDVIHLQSTTTPRVPAD